MKRYNRLLRNGDLVQVGHVKGRMQLQSAYARRQRGILDLVVDEYPRRGVGNNALDLPIDGPALIAVNAVFTDHF